MTSLGAEIYISFHPDSESAKGLAHALYRKYRRDPKAIGSKGFGIPVYFRHRPYPDSDVGLRPIESDRAQATIVLLLIDNDFVDEFDDPESPYTQFVYHLFDLAASDPNDVRLIPIVLEQDARRHLPSRFNKINAIRFYGMTGEEFESRFDELTLRITFDIAQFLKQLTLDEASMGDGLIDRIQLFLSHTQEDANEAVDKLREEIRAHTGLSDFFYPIDTPVGFDFKIALEREIERSAVLIIQSDAYSSREWCRWEVVTAKRIGVPIVLASMVAFGEERAFPYLGNVPVIGFDPAAPPEARNSARAVIQATLEEVLRHLIWRMMVRKMRHHLPEDIKQPLFLPRPPEALNFLFLKSDEGLQPDAIIHPDPPLGLQETDIIQGTGSTVQFLTPSQLSAKLSS